MSSSHQTFPQVFRNERPHCLGWRLLVGIARRRILLLQLSSGDSDDFSILNNDQIGACLDGFVSSQFGCTKDRRLRAPKVRIFRLGDIFLGHGISLQKIPVKSFLDRLPPIAGQAGAGSSM